MSRIHNSSALDGFRSVAKFGAARNRIVSIMNRRVEGITKTARPHHCLAPVRAAGAFVPLMSHPPEACVSYSSRSAPLVYVHRRSGDVTVTQASVYGM